MHCKNENLYFSAAGQTKRIQPILASCEAPFGSNLQKNKTLVQWGSNWSSEGLSEYQCKWEVFPLMGVYILIGVFAIPLMRGVIITYE